MPFLALLPCLLLAAPSAHAAATSEACSGVRIDADASCEHRVEVGCATTCDPRDMLFACAAELAASCQASCNLDADISCTGDCDALCEQRCEVEDVRCDSECADECATHCMDACADADDPAQCRASCEATCDVECADACEGIPVDADCMTHCEECCFGACSATVNFDCQLGCQADAWTICEQELLRDCEASCGIQGSVYCDGQYVAGGESTLECIDDLEDAGLAVETDFAATGFCSVESREPPLSMLVLVLFGLGAGRPRGRWSRSAGTGKAGRPAYADPRQRAEAIERALAAFEIYERSPLLNGPRDRSAGRGDSALLSRSP